MLDFSIGVSVVILHLSGFAGLLAIWVGSAKLPWPKWLRILTAVVGTVVIWASVYPAADLLAKIGCNRSHDCDDEW